VLQMMAQWDVNQVPVLDGRLLAGIISRGDILRHIQMRREVGIQG
jgi:CBS domain-containing protein